jgi:hypothetical protein
MNFIRHARLKYLEICDGEMYLLGKWIWQKEKGGFRRIPPEWCKGISDQLISKSTSTKAPRWKDKKVWLNVNLSDLIMVNGLLSLLEIIFIDTEPSASLRQWIWIIVRVPYPLFHRFRYYRYQRICVHELPEV